MSEEPGTLTHGAMDDSTQLAEHQMPLLGVSGERRGLASDVVLMVQRGALTCLTTKEG